MIKLIKTNLRFLTFNKIFLAAAAAVLYFGFSGGNTSSEYGFSIEHPIFTVLVVSAVTLLNCGRENHDGTLRGKLILGYSRRSVFASFLISSLICSFVLYLLFSLPFFCIGKTLYIRHMTDERLILISLIILCITLLTTVGSVCLSMCISYLPVASIALLAAAIGFVMLNEPLYHRLSEPESDVISVEYQDPSLAEDTDKYPLEYISDLDIYVQYPEQPNQAYIGGAKRQVLRTLYYLDPYSQISALDRIMSIYVDFDVEELLKNGESIDPETVEEHIFDTARTLPYYPLYSLAFILVLSVAGCVVFCKRNIN